VFFVTQTPKDVPSAVLAQLANRIQHALRAFTPDDAKALKATVSTFPRSHYDLAEVLTSPGIGEAVVTVMSETGAPTPVAWTRLRAPESRMAPMDPVAIAAATAASPINARYAQPVDRDSAYEMLSRRLADSQLTPDTTSSTPATPDDASVGADRTSELPRTPARAKSRTSAPEAQPSALEAILSNKTAQKIVDNFTRELARGVFGTRKRR
jgi:DNA helicase HerA-like ATPase